MATGLPIARKECGALESRQVSWCVAINDLKYIIPQSHYRSISLLNNSRIPGINSNCPIWVKLFTRTQLNCITIKPILERNLGNQKSEIIFLWVRHKCSNQGMNSVSSNSQVKLELLLSVCSTR